MSAILMDMKPGERNTTTRPVSLCGPSVGTHLPVNGILSNRVKEKEG